MRQLLLMCGLCVAAAACGAAPLKPVEAAPVSADSETRAAPQKPQREAPPLIAPPPAYGNKIVMARAERDTSTN